MCLSPQPGIHSTADAAMWLNAPYFALQCKDPNPLGGGRQVPSNTPSWAEQRSTRQAQKKERYAQARRSVQYRLWGLLVFARKCSKPKATLTQPCGGGASCHGLPLPTGKNKGQLLGHWLTQLGELWVQLVRWERHWRQERRWGQKTREVPRNQETVPIGSLQSASPLTLSTIAMFSTPAAPEVVQNWDFYSNVFLFSTWEAVRKSDSTPPPGGVPKPSPEYKFQKHQQCFLGAPATSKPQQSISTQDPLHLFTKHPPTPTTHGMVYRPAASVFPGSFLEMQSLRHHFRPAEPESTFEPGPRWPVYTFGSEALICLQLRRQPSVTFLHIHCL